MAARLKLSADVSSMQIEGFSFRFREEVQQALIEASDEIFVPAIRDQLEKNKSIFTRALYESIDTVEGQSTFSQLSIRVGSELSYAMGVEKGLLPHTPEFERLREWVKVKLGLSGPDAHLVAIRISKSIREKGTQPHPYLKDTIDANEKIFAQRVFSKLRR